MKKMRKNFIKYYMRRSMIPAAVVLSALVIFSLTLFQNCSNTSFEKIEQAEKALAAPELQLKSHICGQARFSDVGAGKYVFIIDLSASNFGDWWYQTIGGKKFYYWDPARATDPTGARFDAILEFINNCEGQTGSQFALIGFSRAAGVLLGNQFSCDGVYFSTREQITSQINAFREVQPRDQAWYERWKHPSYLTETQPDSLIYSVTSYTNASQCLEKLILKDLNSASNQTDRYNVFFVSDGVPQDSKNTGCNLSTMNSQQQTACYMEGTLNSITMARTAALYKGKSLKVQGLYYGNGGATPEVLSALSEEGGSAEVELISNFSENRSALCNLVVDRSAIDFQPDVYMTINLSMQIGASRIVEADSDIDGISDAREIVLGYDPQIPRSSGVSGILDGICESLGGIDRCRELREQIACNPNIFDKLGLSDCDLEILGLNDMEGVIDKGVDSDRDGLPDFVEVIKGTDPHRPDMTQDSDSDGVINRTEILKGTSVFSPRGALSDLILNQSELKFNSQAPTCQHGGWELSSRRLQTARTLEVVNTSVPQLSHLRNEQLILVIYRLVPANSLEPEIEYYAKFVKVRASGYVGDEILQAIPSEVLPEDFIMLGKVRP